MLAFLLQWVGAIDLQANELADVNVLVNSRESLVEQEKEIVEGKCFWFCECMGLFIQAYHVSLLFQR